MTGVLIESLGYDHVVFIKRWLVFTHDFCIQVAVLSHTASNYAGVYAELFSVLEAIVDQLWLDNTLGNREFIVYECTPVLAARHLRKL